MLHHLFLLDRFDDNNDECAPCHNRHQVLKKDCDDAEFSDESESDDNVMPINKSPCVFSALIEFSLKKKTLLFEGRG